MKKSHFIRLIFLSTAAASVIVSAAATAVGIPQAVEGNIVAQFKANFDAAMAKPLEERTKLLEWLEQDIDSAVSARTLTGMTKNEALYYKFRAQHQLAKHAQACQTCAAYIQGIRDYNTFEPMRIPYLKNLPLRIGSVSLTKCHVNKRMFYYIQFLVNSSRQPHQAYCNVPNCNTNANRVWLTLMLGYVTDGSERFVLPQGLYHSLGGPLYGQVVRLEEFNHLCPDFHEAIDLVEARLKSDVRRILVNIERWIDNPGSYAPGLPNRELATLEELQRLKVQLFGRYY